MTATKTSTIQTIDNPGEPWISIKVDRCWPPTWEWPHCGTCDAWWYTLELRDSGWLLWALPSRANYNHGVKVCVFPSAREATEYVRSIRSFDRPNLPCERLHGAEVRS